METTVFPAKEKNVQRRTADIQKKIDKELVARLGLAATSATMFNTVYQFCEELALYQNVMFYLIAVPIVQFHGHGHDFELIDIADSICALGSG